jgi:ectoine hydroxylase-related dioxygenase (phytanoyl-CoA dioxygenase family)
MEAVFDDKAAEVEFGRKGYVVRPFLSHDEITALNLLLETLPPDGKADFYATVFSRNAEYRRRVSDGIGSVIGRRIAEVFPRHELAFAVFVTKRPASTQATVSLHRDYSFTDTRRHTAVHLWCPLVDVDTTNGCLQVVSASHRLVKSPYAVNEYPPVFGHVMDLLYRDFTTTVPMAAGSVLAYDSRLFHASGENRSATPRAACVAILLPKDVRPRVYFWEGVSRTTFEVLEVRPDFLLRMERGAAIQKPYPPDVTYLKSEEYPVEPLRPEDLLLLNPDETEKRAWPARESPTTANKETLPIWKVYTPANIVREICYRLRRIL